MTVTAVLAPRWPSAKRRYSLYIVLDLHGYFSSLREADSWKAFEKRVPRIEEVACPQCGTLPPEKGLEGNSSDSSFTGSELGHTTDPSVEHNIPT
jgi:hypothetical protein